MEGKCSGMLVNQSQNMLSLHEYLVMKSYFESHYSKAWQHQKGEK
jgi:hypothetical protein